MIENAPPPGAKKRPPARLFLETTAQILRLQGPPELKRQIIELIGAAHKSGCVIGTSAHVKREFDNVYSGFFKEVKGRIASLPDPARHRQFEHLWHEVLGLMAPIYPGGHTLLDDLTIMFIARYAGMRVPPTFIQNIVTGIKADLRDGFFRGDLDLFDESSCEVWETRGRCFDCHPDPDDACQLRRTCVTNGANFLASAATMCDARRKESKWFKKNLDRLQSLEGKPLHEFLGRHPDPTGDPIIFWEVPDGWTILSRDRTFQVLRDAHRKELGFYMVRLPRLNSNQQCKVRVVGAEGDIDATLLNYNAKGARFRAVSFSAAEGQAVVVTAEQLGSSRHGEISRMDPLLPGTFGVKFKLKRARP